jgi:anti-sigma factor RsiW
MRCADVREGLVALFDGELESPEREAIREHLAACPECAREAAELRRTLDLLASWSVQDEADPAALAAELTALGRRVSGLEQTVAALRRELRALRAPAPVPVWGAGAAEADQWTPLAPTPAGGRRLRAI